MTPFHYAPQDEPMTNMPPPRTTMGGEHNGQSLRYGYSYDSPPAGQPIPTQAPPPPRASNGGSQKKFSGFTSDAIHAAAQQKGLVFPEHAVEQIVAAVDAGKHLILTGPPGTGKTTLAYLAGEVARRSMMCTGYMPTTATPEWTTFETIGGIQPTPDGLLFRPGMFIEAIETGQWLIIDELNRANFDRAFGQLFTVLSGQSVVLPFKRKGESYRISVVPHGDTPPPETSPLSVPMNWRIIGTMNVFDKNLLFDLSYALMRRFAFIEVGCPSQAVYEELLGRVGAGGATVRELMVVRQFIELGPAVFLDAAKYAGRRAQDGVSQSRLLYEVFYAYFLPQFEGVNESVASQVYNSISGLLDPVEQQETIRNFREVLGHAVGE